MSKARDKISNLLSTIDELQSSDSQNQLAAKRAERELREEREKALRLERELEGWKGLRMERGTGVNRSGTLLALSEMNEKGRGSRRSSAIYGGRTASPAPGSSDGAAPQRKFSNSKGFL